MTRYLLVHHGGEEHVLPETPLPSEEKLHDAFELDPELFPAGELNLGQMMVVGREVGFESGAADLICVDEGGQIVIIELKTGTENPDSRRVVAQMLDYGAHLWGYNLKDFEAKIVLPYLKRRLGVMAPSSLQEAVARQFSLEDAEGGVDGFASALARNLEQGTFTYVVIARTLPPTLKTVLRYVAEISRIQTAAITVDYYQDGERQILAPRVAFASADVQRPSQTSTPSGRTTPQQFLHDVGDAEAYWSDLIAFLETLPGKFLWGTKRFSYRLFMDGKEHSVLRGYPRTTWWLIGKGHGDELDFVIEPTPNTPEEFRRRVSEATTGLKDLPGANLKSQGAERFASFYVKDPIPAATDRAIRDTLRVIFAASS